MRPMILRPLGTFLLAAAIAMPALAADPAPEISRDPAPPQKTGVLHALRTIPEACARLQGRFTGDPARPYRFQIVRTSPACQARAKLVDAAGVEPSRATGWIFNDLIRVPSAACATRQAVVRVWRHPADGAPPALDRQGRSRIYLEDGLRKARAGQLHPVPVYAASMQMEGLPCK